FLALYAAIRYLFTRHFRMPNPPSWVQVTLFWGIAVIYLTSGWSSTGKTFGKQFVGVRVVRADGGRLRTRLAFGRAVLYGVFPPGSRPARTGASRTAGRSRPGAAGRTRRTPGPPGS